ncbi:SatD family (SatD) [Algoriphagus faecimaris]|uniref:SatD family (SatD) n=1 Tax=Algoriphagus faecimaris TaxID=686796 RepID=A0A1G6T2D3_9BACT|nr:SatD family protein [Algoriphagus faecimaris]SDD23123.1 SatD family (SatD) [Algoriphagus faecimaris]
MLNWILMGDIIDSRKENAVLLQQEFAKLIDQINQDFADDLLSPLTITLGDEFQCVVKNLKALVEILIKLEEQKWSLNCPVNLRYSLGYGEISTPINSEIAYGMIGSGLMKVRESLTELKEEEDRVVIIGEVLRREELKLALDLFLELQQSWKWKDRAIISGYFLTKDYKQVAKTMEKDVSLIWRRFKSLAFKSYQKRKRLVKLISEDVS